MSEPPDDIPILDKTADSIPNIHRFFHEAMAAVFSIFIVHPDPDYAAQAARDAFVELDKLEAKLSRFISNSDISQINSLPIGQPLRLSEPAFESIQLCKSLYTETNRAFDITAGLLVDCWLKRNKKTPVSFEERLDFARQHTGLDFVKLDQDNYAVQLLTAPLKIDLGGFGKGYAVDKMADILRDWSIDSALISGGYSSVLVLEPPPDIPGWPITLTIPDRNKRIFARLDLKNRAVSGSGMQKGTHIIDPRTAKPVETRLAAWSAATDAATADVLSTAFMIMSPTEIEQYCTEHTDTLAVIITPQPTDEDPQNKQISWFGQWQQKNLLKN